VPFVSGLSRHPTPTAELQWQMKTDVCWLMRRLVCMVLLQLWLLTTTTSGTGNVVGERPSELEDEVLENIRTKSGTEEEPVLLFISPCH
jgi:hypothetical protein